MAKPHLTLVPPRKPRRMHPALWAVALVFWPAVAFALWWVSAAF